MLQNGHGQINGADKQTPVRTYDPHIYDMLSSLLAARCLYKQMNEGKTVELFANFEKSEA